MAELTAEIFGSFIFGVCSLVGGGILFEGGKTFVKTGGSNEFKGKFQALPFFFLTLTIGFALQHLDPAVDQFVYSIPPLTRAGTMVLGSMFLFNYSVPNFNYVDEKSVPVYLLGLVLVALPLL